MHMVNSAWSVHASDVFEHVCAVLFMDLWDAEASESASVFTLRFPAQERSRRTLPQRDGACKGWEDTSLSLRPLPNGPGVSGVEGQTCRATVTLRCQGGGERSPRSCLCRIDKRTVESRPPRYPATASDDPAQEQRIHHHNTFQAIEEETGGKEACRWNYRTCEKIWYMHTKGRIIFRRFNIFICWSAYLFIYFLNVKRNLDSALNAEKNILNNNKPSENNNPSWLAFMFD